MYTIRDRFDIAIALLLRRFGYVRFLETEVDCAYNRLNEMIQDRKEAEDKLEEVSMLFCDTLSQWMKCPRTDVEVDFIQGVRKKITDITDGVVGVFEESAS